MPRFVALEHPAPPAQFERDPDDLLARLQETLAALADIECRYDALGDRLERSSGHDAATTQLLTRLEERKRAEREPLDRMLAELHYQMLRVAMARELGLPE